MKKIINLSILALLIFTKLYSQPGLYDFKVPKEDIWKYAYKQNKVASISTDTSLRYLPKNYTYWRKELRRAQDNPAINFKFWEDTFLTKSSSLTGLFNFETGSLATEWLVDDFGIWRLSAGSALTIAKDSTVKDFQSFINGGGNLFVKAITPIYLWVNAQHPSKRYFSIYFSPKIGAVLPGLGQTQNDSISWNADAAFEAHLKIAGNQEKIALFTVLRSGVSVGSKSFVQNITSDKRQFFGYTIGSIGLILNKNVMVQLNFPIRMGGNLDPIDKVPSSLSVSILNSK
jgi:hypothetical protein